MPTDPQRRHLSVVPDEPAEVKTTRRPRILDRRYIVTVTLDGIEPQITRTLQVSSHITLPDLHEGLQVAMGWQNYHLHKFVVGNDPWDRDAVGFHSQIEIDLGDLEPGNDRSEVGVRLDELLTEPGDSILYEYDYGDGWTHRLTLDAAADRIDNPTRCIDGARACPPEDCGGPSGYARLLEVLANPSHPEHSHLRSWAGDFEPERFDVAQINTALRNRERRAQVAAAAVGQSALVADLLSRTAPEAVPLLMEALELARLGDPADIDPIEATTALTKITWMIDHIGDRLKLTGAGYLPPTIVKQMRDELDWTTWKFYGSSNRESDHFQATLMRESIVDLGLARKVKGELILTKTALKLREDAPALWRHVASRAPRGHDKADREAGVIALIAAAANIIDDTAVVLETMPALGWRAENPRAFTLAAMTVKRFLWLLGAKPSSSSVGNEIPRVTTTFARAALTLGAKV